MTDAPTAHHDAELDLVLERTVPIAVEQVWAAWTEPEQLPVWFAPRPWATVGCEIELRPGGAFATVMRSPDGDEFPSVGCYLVVDAPRRLVFTSALLPGFRPLPDGDDDGLLFTAELTFEADGDGTRYTARAIHGTSEAAEQHRQMGFVDGWGAALDQLVEHVRGLPT